MRKKVSMLLLAFVAFAGTVSAAKVKGGWWCTSGNAYVVTFEVFGRNQINIGIETEDWDRYGSALHFDNDRL